ncbi:hypothetical protein COLO4_22251 [Corchorus olitorius]|uniref:Uncharacterized protein n=1 Tax=Corchorus olitorius TaxID=93759 RepID=A0A1R3INB9_9ROSI|nr:hypothetical protein COLO4_22251 [Corchorus olitorius]
MRDLWHGFNFETLVSGGLLMGCIRCRRIEEIREGECERVKSRYVEVEE